MVSVRFPLEPLLETAAFQEHLLFWETENAFVGGHRRENGVVSAAAEFLGCHRGQVYRWREYGLGRWQADRAACSVGLHPLLVWPDWS